MTTPSINGGDLKATTWERRFELFERLEANKKGRLEVLQSAAYRSLPRRERWLLSCNVSALFGGFFFYVSKGMNIKAGIIASMTLLWGALLSWLEYTLGVRFPLLCYWLPPSAITSQWANFDYYRKVTIGESLWSGWSSIRRAYRHKIVLSLLIVAVLLFGGVRGFSHFYQHATAGAMSSEDAIAIECGINKVYVMPHELNLFGEEAICSNF
ncbi:MAG: hypothetical protein ACTMIA_06680 [Vibrio sp.]